VIGGVALADLFSQSRAIENALYPYAVILQVTPVVAITPLILIWVGFDRINLVLVIIAFIVAFFPILSNTTLGSEIDRPQSDRPVPPLWREPLADPDAAPVADCAAESAGRHEDFRWARIDRRRGGGIRRRVGCCHRPCLAHRGSGHNLEIAKMFAALALLAALGIAIFSILSLLEWALLHRWHESAIKKTA
jgi:NitT/TauT family transport system permease protein